MAWLAFDDTDSVQGGCTTHVAFELARLVQGIDLIGPPRLVRLNPTIPHKTRGNGAVAMRWGHGRGAPTLVGKDGDRPIHAYDDGDPLTRNETDTLFDQARRLIGSCARLDGRDTHPGLACFESPPSSEAYHAAVSRYVGLAEALGHARRADARTATWKGGRGLIGATAAAAWPARSVTYEWIAYRDRSRWGSPRGLEGDVGPTLDRRHPSTFDNYDAAREHLRIAPASPCPILAGIRGTEPEDLSGAIARLGPERPAGSLLFATNQATDDQFRSMQVRQVRPFTSPELVLSITGAPSAWRGGHVFVRATDTTGPIDLVAYEPTKEFRTSVRTLRPGDDVRVHGSVQADPGLLALERIEVLSCAPRRHRRAPQCPSCERSMKSRGRAEAYECPTCRRRAWGTADESTAATWRAEVPVSVRRHLTRPFALGPLPRQSAASH